MNTCPSFKRLPGLDFPDPRSPTRLLRAIRLADGSGAVIAFISGGWAKKKIKAHTSLMMASPKMLAALIQAETALKEITGGLDEDEPEPEYPECGDTEDCENWGLEQARWEAAMAAWPALKAVRTAIATAKGR